MQLYSLEFVQAAGQCAVHPCCSLALSGQCHLELSQAMLRGGPAGLCQLSKLSQLQHLSLAGSFRLGKHHGVNAALATMTGISTQQLLLDIDGQ
jgi:hypothetical protein